MSIISHKYKFIFLKPFKVGGSSILQTLGQHCGPEDIVTSPNDTGGLPSYRKNNTGFRTHMRPDEIRNKIPQEIWDSYYKITIVRNPWDEVVSRYHWNLSRWRHKKTLRKKRWIRDAWRRYVAKSLQNGPDHDNPRFIRRFTRMAYSSGKNKSYYFDEDGRPLADFFIKFESLEDDFHTVCKTLGIPLAKLPHLKGSIRPRNDPYWEYYNDETRKIVADQSAKVIDYFGYEFGPDQNQI